MTMLLGEFRLRPDLAIIDQAGGVQLRAGDDEVVVLETEPRSQLRGVLESLRQPSTPATLVQRFGAEHATWISNLLEQLSAARFLVATDDRDDSAKRYWQHFDVGRPEQQAAAETGYRACVVGNGSLAGLIAFVLQQHGMRVGHVTWNREARIPGEDAAMPEAEQPADHETKMELDGDLQAGFNLIVVAWEQPDLSRVLSANHAVITRRVPCLFVDLSHGQHATLGPFYVPNEGACYECYRQWWRRNSRALTELDAAHEQMLTSGRPHPAYGTLPAFRHWLAGMAAAELQALVAGHRPLRTLNRQITIDLEHLAVHGEPVWRIPWCPACGDPPRQLATERSPA